LPVVLHWGETYAIEITRQEVREELGGKKRKERKKERGQMPSDGRST